MIRSKTYIAIPPGETIREQLEFRSMSQKEFALRMNMSEKHISNLINGKVQLTPFMANRLEFVLGIPAHFWSNLEAIYRESLIKVEEENNLNADIELAKKFPYKQMASMGWVRESKKACEKVSELRKFFEIVNLGLLFNDKIGRVPGIICRRQTITEKADYALIAWAQKAKLEARSISVSPINMKHLLECLPEIRKMTLISPEQFCPMLYDVLAKCGIALVFLPHIGGSFLHGATFYNNNKIVMGLTVRGKDADKFWFSLFHELGHIILGHLNQDYTSDEDEYAADKFAKEQLIPSEQFKLFIEKNSFSKEDILRFAKEIVIAPGIVVGRLQKEGYIEFSWHNDLKSKYTISEGE